MLIKKVIKIFYRLSLSIGIIILSFIMIFIGILTYVGPYTTLKVKHGLTKDPQEIIVSLTTTPYRINKIKPVLDSIFRQSIQPTRVYLNIPWKFKRNNQNYIIPDWLKNYPNIIINRTQDYGPATKLIATLEKEHNPAAIIVTLDDDRIYPRHVVRDLIKQYLPNTYKVNYKKNSAITGTGYRLIFGLNYQTLITELIVGDRPSVIVAGFSGVAYKRHFFKDDIFDLLSGLPMTCFLSDDLMISGYLLKNQIPIVKISGITFNYLSSKLLFKLLPTAVTRDALSLGADGIGIGGNEYNYAHCLDILDQYGKADYQQAIFERVKIVNHFYDLDLDDTAFSFWCYKKLLDFFDLFNFFSKLIIKFLG